MKDVAAEILSIAALAEAPKWDFRPWHASAVIQAAFVINAPNKVIGYRVPDGYSLVITRIDSWVSGAYAGATPGTPLPVQESINWPQGFAAYWMADNSNRSDTQAHYLSLSQGEQLFVFNPQQCAKFYLVYNGPGVIASAEQSFAFRFFGFLTLPEIGERLTKVQSVTPYPNELNC